MRVLRKRLVKITVFQSLPLIVVSALLFSACNTGGILNEEDAVEATADQDASSIVSTSDSRQERAQELVQEDLTSENDGGEETLAVADAELQVPEETQTKPEDVLAAQTAEAQVIKETQPEVLQNVDSDTSTLAENSSTAPVNPVPEIQTEILAPETVLVANAPINTPSLLTTKERQAASFAPGEVGIERGVAGEPAAEGLPELGSTLFYVVKKHDTLSKIAKSIYGDMKQWKKLKKLSNIKNPHRLYPGDLVYYQLNEKTLEFARNYSTVVKKEIAVKKGESLSKIAKRIYGNAKKWKSIWRQNSHIKDPNKIEVGTKVYIAKQISLKQSASFAKIKVSIENSKISFEKETFKSLNLVKLIKINSVNIVVS